ncbi:hypothetical protein B0T11DRAFT_350275 [Plectosphaerella cucumerina]|uniref:Uncharacterized protein n=1 Tax=Plectosphaerella cucumerina TaxID=40658 RepID=A0A8K0TJM1_9PEZI|nr:hypothetical protein B0T11DRAFT_350275 [Plectosphaerella cucumerina]
MKTSHCLLLLAQALSIAASPLPVEDWGHLAEPRDFNLLGGAGARGGGGDKTQATPAENAAPAETAAPAEGGAGGEAGGEAGAGEGGEGGEGAANEVEQAGQFDVPIALGGGNVKVDTLYPPGQNGVFEIEFQNADGRTLTVSQNPNPAAPPPGFVAVEPVSFIVNLAEGAEGVTLQKVDYILNKNNTLDISKGSIGRFCPEAGAFVIDPQVGEQEFEVEENELLIKVKNMNGEWAVFVPAAASAAPPAAPPAAPAPAPAPANPAAPATPETMQQFVNLLRSLLATPAA